MFRLLSTLVFCAAPLQAQEVKFDPVHTEACLQEAVEYGERRACIGASANQCMETTPGGYTTVGQGACVWEELQWWDARLNANYKATRAQAKAADDELKSLGSSAPSQEIALRDMQRAWIAFRDAKCGYERTLWGGGTGGGPAEAWCRLYETAMQAMDLTPREDEQ